MPDGFRGGPDRLPASTHRKGSNDGRAPSEHAFSDLFVAYLLARNIRYEEDLVDQLFNSSEKRLARVLLMLAHFGKERCARDRGSQNQPGNFGGNGGYDALASKFFYEPVSQARIYQVPRRQRWRPASP